MNKDNTWEIMVIVRKCNERLKDIKRWSDEYEDMRELYAQAIRLQCSSVGGLVQTVDDFIGDVEDGYLLNSDGFGKFADFDGNKHETVNCDVNWLKKHRKNYPFVFWYNK